MASLVRALAVLQRMAEEQPEAKPTIDPTGPDSNVDLGVHSPANYPALEKKRKATKKVPEASKRKVRKNLTLELPKQEGTVRFDTIVLVKCRKQKTMRILKGYSHSDSLFARKRTSQKLRMRQRHQQRALTPRRFKIQQHVRDTLARVNS